MKCEACEINAAEVIESCDDSVEPYHVCSACHKRLLARALRPLEWYNLAKRHGWHQFLLHDDFYDEEGRADQPEIEVVETDKYPAPSLLEANVDIDGLLDYSITRWSLHSELIEAWNAYPKPEVLSTIQKRFFATMNAGIRAYILELSALCLCEYGAEFVRNAWNFYPEELSLGSLAQASASCLPHQEGYDRVAAALDALEGGKKRDRMYALGYFRSAKTLDWIETNITEPITESWGNLAALSNADWPRLESWLLRGRPLSHVAIDTLRAIQRMPAQTLIERRVRLDSLPSQTQLHDVLERYARLDPVPRVRQRIDSILKNYVLLTRKQHNPSN